MIVSCVVLTDPRFSDMIPAEFPAQDGPFSDYSLGDSEKSSFGGYSNRLHFHGSEVDQGPFPDGPSVGSFRLSGGGDDFGRSSLQEKNSRSRMYPDYQSHPLNHPMDNAQERPDAREPGAESSSLPNTLLRYLVIPLSLNRILSNKRNVLVLTYFPKMIF